VETLLAGKKRNPQRKAAKGLRGKKKEQKIRWLVKASPGMGTNPLKKD